MRVNVAPNLRGAEELQEKVDRLQKLVAEIRVILTEIESATITVDFEVTSSD